MILFFFLLAGVSWFFLVALFYERYIAFLSTVLFITTPFIVSYSRVVLSELPTLSLIILASYLFFRFLETETENMRWPFLLRLRRASLPSNLPF